jgi:hypothetical protein
MTVNLSTDHPLTELAGSELDQNLLGHFQQHVDGEQELLEAYARFRDQGPEYVGYLTNIILADEARHHRMFQELVNRIRSDIDWRDYGPHVPFVDSPREQAAQLVEATDRLLQFEHEDAKALHRLQKELRPVRDTTLFSLLVELMQLDTKKHIAILQFIRRQATERP